MKGDLLLGLALVAATWIVRPDVAGVAWAEAANVGEGSKEQRSLLLARIRSHASHGMEARAEDTPQCQTAQHCALYAYDTCDGSNKDLCKTYCHTLGNYDCTPCTKCSENVMLGVDSSIWSCQCGDDKTDLANLINTDTCDKVAHVVQEIDSSGTSAKKCYID